MKSLFFNIGTVRRFLALVLLADISLDKQTSYELNANAQIWPRSMNSTLGGDDNTIYLVTADMGALSGQGLDFISAELRVFRFSPPHSADVRIDGYAFLQRFYSVFDSTNSQVGLANTEDTLSTTN